MKILVDTSVWVDFFNQFPSREAAVLADLLLDEVEVVTCGVVVAEFFQGIRKTESLPELETHFRDMTSLVPREPDTYLAAAALFRELRARGITIRSTIDCLIARLAEENSALLLAKDRDLHRILDSELCELRSIPV